MNSAEIQLGQFEVIRDRIQIAELTGFPIDEACENLAHYFPYTAGSRIQAHEWNSLLRVRNKVDAATGIHDTVQSCAAAIQPETASLFVVGAPGIWAVQDLAGGDFNPGPYAVTELSRRNPGCHFSFILPQVDMSSTPISVNRTVTA